MIGADDPELAAAVKERRDARPVGFGASFAWSVLIAVLAVALLVTAVVAVHEILRLVVWAWGWS